MPQISQKAEASPHLPEQDEKQLQIAAVGRTATLSTVATCAEPVKERRAVRVPS